LTLQQERRAFADILSRHRHINFVHATPDESELLTQACEIAFLDVKQENTLDETYRKAGKINWG